MAVTEGDGLDLEERLCNSERYFFVSTLFTSPPIKLRTQDPPQHPNTSSTFPHSNPNPHLLLLNPQLPLQTRQLGLPIPNLDIDLPIPMRRPLGNDLLEREVDMVGRAVQTVGAAAQLLRVGFLEDALVHFDLHGGARVDDGVAEAFGGEADGLAAGRGGC